MDPYRRVRLAYCGGAEPAAGGASFPHLARERRLADGGLGSAWLPAHGPRGAAEARCVRRDHRRLAGRRPPRQPVTWPCPPGMRHGLGSEAPARGSSQYAEAVDLPGGPRETGPLVRRRGTGSRGAPGPPRGAANGSTASAGWPSARSGPRRSRPPRASPLVTLPRNAPPDDGRLRAQGDPEALRDAGAGTRPLRAGRPPRDRHRPRTQRHGHDPCRPRVGAGRLPERAYRRVFITAAAPRAVRSGCEGRLAGIGLPIIDESGFAPLSETGRRAAVRADLAAPKSAAPRRSPAISHSTSGPGPSAPETPDRRPARPTDPPRHHPREGRRRPSPRPRPRPQGRNRNPITRAKAPCHAPAIYRAPAPRRSAHRHRPGSTPPRGRPLLRRRHGEDAPVPPGSNYGYARVSTTDRDIDLQYETLEKAGCRVIRAEKGSGTSVPGGDELVVTRVDRLARSMGDVQDIIRELEAKSATLRAAEQPIDTPTPAGMTFLDMLGGLREVRDDPTTRTADGGSCEGEGPWRLQGRKASIDRRGARQLLAEGIRPSAVARLLGISRTSVWRVSRPATDEPTFVQSDSRVAAGPFPTDRSPPRHPMEPQRYGHERTECRDHLERSAIAAIPAMPLRSAHPSAHCGQDGRAVCHIEPPRRTSDPPSAIRKREFGSHWVAERMGAANRGARSENRLRSRLVLAYRSVDIATRARPDAHERLGRHGRGRRGTARNRRRSNADRLRRDGCSGHTVRRGAV